MDQVHSIFTGGAKALVGERKAAASLSVLERAAFEFLREVPQSFDPASESSRFLTYWMLMGIPWPRWVGLPYGDALGQPQPYPLVSGLGCLFDTLNLRGCALRTWANQWLEWSEECLKELALVRLFNPLSLVYGVSVGNNTTS